MLQAVQVRLVWGPDYTCMAHGAPGIWVVYCSSREDVQGHVEHGIFWLWRVHNCHLRVRCPQGSKTIAPPSLICTNCDLCHWSAIYWSEYCSVSFTLESGIEIQNSRDTTESQVNTPWATGVWANTWETHGRELFVRLVEHANSWVGYQDLSFVHVGS